jgi:hypothetical protein
MLKPKSVRIAEAQISPELRAQKEAITQLFFKTEGKGGEGVEEYNRQASIFNDILQKAGLGALQSVMLEDNGKTAKQNQIEEKNHKTALQEDRFYLPVPFDQKDEVKKDGAKWDGIEKQWFFIPTRGMTIPDSFKKYMHPKRVIAMESGRYNFQ